MPIWPMSQWAYELYDQRLIGHMFHSTYGQYGVRTIGNNAYDAYGVRKFLNHILIRIQI